MKSKSILKTILSFSLAALLVYFAFRNIDWNVFVTDLFQTRWAYLIIFFAASILALVFRMFRWNDLLEPLGEPTKKMRVWDANNIGNMICVAVPGSGEFFRCAYMTRGKARYENVFGTMVLERGCDFLAIFIMLAMSVFFSRDKFSAFVQDNIIESVSSRFSFWWIAVAVVLLIALMCYLLWHFRDKNKFCAKLWSYTDGLAKGFVSFLKMRHKLLFLLYTVGIWTMYLLMCWSVMKAIPACSELSMVDALFFTTIGNLASIIPVPGGIGAYHYLMATALTTIYGGTWETGILLATLQHELHAVLIIILGVISYFAIKRH